MGVNMDGVLNVLLEYGALGLFAAFLVWQHLSMQKRFDSLIEKFQVQIDKIRDDHRSDVDELRQRYDSVISNYNDERSKLRQEIATKISENRHELSDLQKDIGRAEGKIDSMFVAVELCSTILKDMQTEQKIRAMALAAKQKTNL